MRFSVYQTSRRGGREKNEDRMGYCYRRDSGLFVEIHAEHPMIFIKYVMHV